MPSVSEKSRRPCDAGLDDRCRDEDGEIRRKRGDTLVGTLRREYGDDFAKGFRSDVTLAALLRETNSASLSDYLRRRQPAPGRPATARDTARVLGVSETRADRLIRTVSGEIRRKHWDTHTKKRDETLVRTLRKTYGGDFAKDFRGDATLGTVLRETNSASLSDYLRRRR